MVFGLLALVALLFVLYAAVEVPLLLDPNAWFALRGWPVLLFVFGLAVYGFWVSLGGKSPFGRAFED
jgi:hypothetical protein